MKIHRFLAACVVFVSVIFIGSCVIEGGSGDSFARKLRGTWVSHNSDEIYSGQLVIDYNRITISGYKKYQPPLFGKDVDDSNRPFRDFTKDAVLKGYSEKGKNLKGSSEDGYIFIEEFGKLHDGIYYVYYEDMAHNKFLRFTFGDREETLRYTVVEY